MKEFALLIEKIEQTKSTKEKTFLIQRYFETAPSSEAAWALFFLSGNKLKRIIGPSLLYEWAIDTLDLPSWLIDESYGAVGDLAETIALLMPKNKNTVDYSLSDLIHKELLPLEKEEKEVQKRKIIEFWNHLETSSIFILNKILTGSLRIGVSHLLTIQALSQALKVPKEIISQRLMGQWSPSAAFFDSLKLPLDPEVSHLNPYPFYLASPLQESLESLGSPKDWFAEWKWDGIRGQGIHRDGKAAIWSRGNELVTYQFPEIAELLLKLPEGTVLDGEILAYQKGMPLPFGELQKRLGRKKVTSSMIENVPLVFMVYDLLEYQHQDIRKKPLCERRALFEKWESEKLIISPLIPFDDWKDIEKRREEALTNNTEGLLLKKKNSPYLNGRRRGNWWKFKVDPKTIDAVLMYAQPGQGWRANLYTDYTFGVFKDQELVPIAKAYSGLSMDEIYLLDKWIRKNTLEKFGSVRRVRLEQVFEIAFEGMQKSSRHKSGVAVRFPRISRWRTDKPINECDTLEQVIKEHLKE